MEEGREGMGRVLMWKLEGENMTLCGVMERCKTGDEVPIPSI